jgi:8-oxo-dGTP pyrophosphatase MutT (NUDIX family)
MSGVVSFVLDKPTHALVYWHSERVRRCIGLSSSVIENVTHKRTAMAPLLKRKRATAIVEYSDGILLTLMRFMGASLPGGGVKPGESDEAAVIRELYEETRLRAIQTVFLFRHTSLANDHAVFWVVADGHPQPSDEVDQLAYYRPGLAIKVSPETQTLLKHVYQYKATHPEVFSILNTTNPGSRD